MNSEVQDETKQSELDKNLFFFNCLFQVEQILEKFMCLGLELYLRLRESHYCSCMCSGGLLNSN